MIKCQRVSPCLALLSITCGLRSFLALAFCVALRRAAMRRLGRAPTTLAICQGNRPATHFLVRQTRLSFFVATTKKRRIGSSPIGKLKLWRRWMGLWGRVPRESLRVAAWCGPSAQIRGLQMGTSLGRPSCGLAVVCASRRRWRCWCSALRG